MQEPTLERRVGSLELRADDVEGRVRTVERELKEFRSDVQREFASVRAEMREGFTRVDQEFATVRQEASEFRAEVRGEFATAHARMDRQFEEARQLTLVLHEDLVSRIKTLGEGLPARKTGSGTEA